MWILASFVISRLFYDTVWVNKSPFCLNLDPVLLFVSLSVVLLAFC